RARWVRGHSESGDPLCLACYDRNPVSHRACSRCGSVERLFHHGLCNACARVAEVNTLLASADGIVRRALEPLRDALLAGNPWSALFWLRRSTTKTILAALVANPGPVTHEVLDRLAHRKAVQHLRAILVAEGALPPRDEHLTTLERWLPAALDGVADA